MDEIKTNDPRHERWREKYTTKGKIKQAKINFKRRMFPAKVIGIGLAFGLLLGSFVAWLLI